MRRRAAAVTSEAGALDAATRVSIVGLAVSALVVSTLASVADGAAASVTLEASVAAGSAGALASVAEASATLTSVGVASAEAVSTPAMETVPSVGGASGPSADGGMDEPDETSGGGIEEMLLPEETDGSEQSRPGGQASMVVGGREDTLSPDETTTGGSDEMLLPDETETGGSVQSKPGGHAGMEDTGGTLTTDEEVLPSGMGPAAVMEDCHDRPTDSGDV